MLAIWSLVPLPFLKPAWTMEVHGSHIAEAWLGEFWALLYYCVRWVQLCSNLSILWHCLSLRLGMKTDLFQSCGHGWVFQICWHIECSTFTASPFRIWNSSTGIPSPPLALFIVMLPKAHLTSHSRMSSELNSPIPVHLSLLIPRMSMFTLDTSCWPLPICLDSWT